VRVSYGPAGALAESAGSVWVMSVLTVKMLAKIVTLEVSAKNISGPLTIAQFAGDTVQIGWDRFLLFLAIVSISLGVLNLLPIPVLDGGHLLYFAMEAVTGTPPSEQVMIWGQQIGLAMLFALMSLAFYNDIVRLLQ
jgi:regulator of sigma E protease